MVSLEYYMYVHVFSLKCVIFIWSYDKQQHEIVIKKNPRKLLNFGYVEHLDVSNFFLGPFEFEITRFHCIYIGNKQRNTLVSFLTWAQEA
jgi:hypothetical protein